MGRFHPETLVPGGKHQIRFGGPGSQIDGPISKVLPRDAESKDQIVMETVEL